ncbi:hypothetical protein ARMGADRAFT_1032436 [Armillaria gallica]|uniref:Uncharacterized protein n=1 Tax=Armillaria gallica TaxID=47427 RepID=A0A2H3DHQ8_ARMGA|nr:hypothetical protein ARMGADRAFT_1032436 [Armillaria gallica]
MLLPGIGPVIQCRCLSTTALLTEYRRLYDMKRSLALSHCPRIFVLSSMKLETPPTVQHRSSICFGGMSVEIHVSEFDRVAEGDAKGIRLLCLAVCKDLAVSEGVGMVAIGLVKPDLFTFIHKPYLTSSFTRLVPSICLLYQPHSICLACDSAKTMQT